MGGNAAAGPTSLYRKVADDLRAAIAAGTYPPGTRLPSQIAPGVVLVTGPGGRGMTCSPAIAEETFQ